MKQLSNFWYFVLLVFTSSLHGQDALHIQEGTVMSIEKGTLLHLSDLSIANNGEINGSEGNLFLSSAHKPLNISGKPITLASLILEVPEGTQLETSINIEDEVKLVEGVLDIGDYSLTLGETRGRIIGETNSNRIIGNQGQIVKRAMLNAPDKVDPGNLGFEISSLHNLGLTEIRRGHLSLNLPTGSAVSRYYTVSSESGITSEWNIRFNFFKNEANQADFPYQIWKQQGNRWISMPGSEQMAPGDEYRFSISSSDFQSADRYTAGPAENLEEELASIPTAFTPNGDGLNDEFVIPWIQHFPDAVVSIFNRWGDKVYEKSNYHIQAWNGLNQGRTLAPASYIYVIRFTGNREPLKGKISIVR